MSGSAPAGKNTRRDIQGLRALAVLAVIFDHVVGWPVGGFIGVDVFFVISGYIITTLLLREHARTGSISPRRFYVRRIRRVLPVAAVVLYLTVLVSILAEGLTERSKETAIDAVWAFFFVANWRSVSEGTDYFEQGQRPSPLQHYWSLGVEEQFYLVWPWLLLLLFVLGARASQVGKQRDSVNRAIAGVAIAIIGGCSYWWAHASTAGDPTMAYFSSFTRAWELGVGALIAVVAPAFVRLPGAVRYVLAYTGLTGIVASLFLVRAESGFPAPWALLPVLSTAVVILAGEGATLRNWPLTGVVANYLGDISYSLYLWHFPVTILLALYLLPGQPPYVLTALVCTLVLSVASFHVIEDPIRRSSWLEDGWDLQQTGRWFASVGFDRVILPASVFACAIFVIIALLPVDPPRSGDPLAREGTSVAAGDRPSCFGAVVVTRPDDCEPVADEDAVYPTPSELESDSKESYTCFTLYGAEQFETCEFGVPDSDVRIAVVGDSHAAVLIPALARAADDRGWSVSAFVGQGCTWGAAFDCPSLPRMVEAINGGDFDVAVTSAYRRNSAGDKALAAALMVDEWRGVRVPLAVVADVPEVSEDAINCISLRNVSADSDCSTSQGTAFALEDPLRRAAQDAGRPLIDLNDLLCPAGDCPAIIGNALVYRDELSHLTDTYSRTLGTYLANRLETALPRAFGKVA